MANGPEVRQVGATMTELETIQAVLDQAASQHRIAKGVLRLTQGLLIGSLLCVVIVGAYHLYPFPGWTLGVAVGAPFLGMVVGFIAGFWHKPTAAEMARWVDARRALKERLSTALEISGRPGENAWNHLILADAAQHATHIEPRKLLPIHLPRLSRWALAVLALAAGLGFVPEYRSKTVRKVAADQQNVKETGRLLAELTQHKLQNRPPAFEPTQKSMEAVSSLGEQLAKQNLTRSDALKDLANVAEKLKDQLKEMGKDPALKRLEDVARSQGGSDSQTAAGLQKQIDSLQKQLGSPTGTPDALDKVQKNLEKLQQAAKAMSDPSSSGGDAERQKVSEALSALSKQLQALGMQLPQLDEAISALAVNQTDLFLKDLEGATTDLEKMKEMAKALQQLQQQMDKLGRDLAEQLQNGQPELAHQTLQKMISQLNSANLSPEQLRQMLNEVSKAVAPAANYGAVADLLKQAGSQLNASNKAGASQSLAAAAKELEKLMQQLGDSQELAETLDSLNQASASLASGQCWRPGRGRPSFKPGGKPGGGVGTWADEDGSWDGQSTAGWDNSSVVRPDMAGRGLTDRGEGELSDALKPTKVKGQFSPGSQMPSVTLKGISIKGQSKVDYAEAAGAAQSDAQSALSQDKVPRAYQGAVKDYFDDLKK